MPPINFDSRGETPEDSRLRLVLEQAEEFITAGYRREAMNLLRQVDTTGLTGHNRAKFNDLKKRAR
jgi:hypothetical protein